VNALSIATRSGWTAGGLSPSFRVARLPPMSHRRPLPIPTLVAVNKAAFRTSSRRPTHRLSGVISDDGGGLPRRSLTRRFDAAGRPRCQLQRLVGMRALKWYAVRALKTLLLALLFVLSGW